MSGSPGRRVLMSNTLQIVTSTCNHLERVRLASEGSDGKRRMKPDRESSNSPRQTGGKYCTSKSNDRRAKFVLRKVGERVQKGKIKIELNEPTRQAEVLYGIGLVWKDVVTFAKCRAKDMEVAVDEFEAKVKNMTCLPWNTIYRLSSGL